MHRAVLPQAVGVLGGGRMGSGIAHAFLVSGCDVVLVEANTSAVESARQRVAKSLTVAHDKGSLAELPEEVLARLTATEEPGRLVGCDLVIEAVPEDAVLKATVLRTAERSAPDATLATNTSSLSVDGFARGLRSPRAILGSSLLQSGSGE